MTCSGALARAPGNAGEGPRQQYRKIIPIHKTITVQSAPFFGVLSGLPCNLAMENTMGDLSKDFNIDSFREGNRFEAKLAKGGFPKSLWETYSSFANTDGGLILLGVKENRDHSFTIEGVENPDLFIKNIWDTLNNPNKVSINLLLNKHVYAKEINGRNIVCIEIPRAERQFRPVYIGKNLFDGTFHRNGEGDYCCSKEEISEMFRDANAVSSDTKILTEMDETVFCKDTVKSYRNRFKVLHMNHVWESLDDIEFIAKHQEPRCSWMQSPRFCTETNGPYFPQEFNIIQRFPNMVHVQDLKSISITLYRILAKNGFIHFSENFCI